MEGFDTMTMNYLASPLALANMPGADYLNAMGPMDLADQQSNFDAETFVSGDDMTFAHGLQHPGMKRFSSGFEDPFALDMSQFETLPPEQAVPESSVERDNKLLGFSMPIYNFTLLDYSLRRTSLSLSAQLHGMFFLAESPWTSATDTGPPPAELTCYRRNLFQITGSITLPRGLRYIMTEQGDRIPILAQELTISATESVEGNSVKIISVPWKTPASGAVVAEDKTEKEPPSIPLDTMAGQDLDSDYATFPIAWKRLQFRIATANNGRRKELQQHFVVRLKVVATLSTGAKISICEANSGPIIVRGRSPRNFQSRKDFPISGSTSSARKSMQQQPSMARTSTSESTPQQGTAPPKQEKTPEVPQMIFQYNETDLQPSPGFPDWTQIATTSTTPLLSTLPTPTFPIQNPMGMPTSVPSQMPQPHQASSNVQSSPEISAPPPQHRQSQSQPPLHLSLLEGDTPPSSSTLKSNKRPSATSAASNSKPRSSTLPASTATIHQTSPPTNPNKSKNPRLSNSASNTLSHSQMHNQNAPHHENQIHNKPSSQSPSLPLTSSTPDETADLLYEYFPLGLDDWMPPVDAVYRPHVVHHTLPMPPDPKALAVMRRSKRYFSEDHP